MKRSKIYIASVVALSLGITSCADDFLNVDSRETVEAKHRDEIFEPEAFITGVYGMFTEWDYAFSFLGITEILSDNADKGSSLTDKGTDKDVLDDLTYNAGNAGSFHAMWTRWYKTIGRATLAIEYTGNFGLADEAYKNRLIGEARFIRALNYFYLVRGWGAVPLQHEDLVRRAPESEVYAYIEQDLLAAIDVLPLKGDYASKDIGRATKGAAQGLLSKVYLYQGKHQQAADMAKAVIASGQYALEPDYAKIWREEGENGPESLFEFQARGESIAHGIQQYSQTQGARGTGGWGWGFNVPSENLLNAFLAEKDSVRMNATIMFRGETLYDGRQVNAGAENPMYNEKAYDSANPGGSDNGKNLRYLRLGEIYLILAEAANELGNTAEALQALNTVRNRAKLPDFTSTNQGEIRNKIWNERRLELAFEHDRWSDLVRTRQAEAAMRAYGKDFKPAKHYLFPVHTNQLIQTPGFEQNPGW